MAFLENSALSFVYGSDHNIYRHAFIFKIQVCMLTVKRTVDQNIKTEHREPNNEIEKKNE